MGLTPALQRLPPVLDVAAAAAAVAALPDGAWLPISDGGGSLGGVAVPLVAPGGVAGFDFSLAGPAAATDVLAGSPSLFDLLRTLLVSLGATVARARVAHCRAAATIPTACLGYQHFRRRVVVVALQAPDSLALACGGEQVALRAGEVWQIDVRRPHHLENPTQRDCRLLVIELGESLRSPALRDPAGTASPSENALGREWLEPYAYRLLTPDELGGLCREIVAGVAAAGLAAEEQRLVECELAALQAGWQAAFARYGHARAGELTYQDVLVRWRQGLCPLLNRRGIARSAVAVIDSALAVAPPAAHVLHRPLPPLSPPSIEVIERALAGRGVPASTQPLFTRPLFIVSAPRAGSTVLFDLLARLPGAVTLGGESHAVIRGIPALHPAARGYASDALSAADATPAVAAEFRQALAARLRWRDGSGLFAGSPPIAGETPRFIEKTPANALRLPFLRSVFPEAQFIYLQRDARENISSLLEGWRERRFIAYPALPGWPHAGWSFLLPPGWQDYVGRPLVEIAAFQYRAANAAIARDLADLPPTRVTCLDFAELVASPATVLRRLADFAGLRWDGDAEAAATAGLRLSKVTLSAPRPGKWRRHADELATVLTDCGSAFPVTPSPAEDPPLDTGLA